MTDKPAGPKPPKGTAPGTGPTPPPPAPVGADDVNELAELHTRYSQLTMRTEDLENALARLQSEAEKLQHDHDHHQIANSIVLQAYRALLMNIQKLRREGSQPINMLLSQEEQSYLYTLVNEGGLDLSPYQ